MMAALLPSVVSLPRVSPKMVTCNAADPTAVIWKTGPPPLLRTGRTEVFGGVTLIVTFGVCPLLTETPTCRGVPAGIVWPVGQLNVAVATGTGGVGSPTGVVGGAVEVSAQPFGTPASTRGGCTD